MHCHLSNRHDYPAAAAGFCESRIAQHSRQTSEEEVTKMVNIVTDQSHTLDADKPAEMLTSMSDNDSSLLKGSLLYQEFLAEREEILRHKWFQSEKAGHDIGFEKALLDWIVRHRAGWRAARREIRKNTVV